MLFLYKMTKLFGKNKINNPILNFYLVSCWNLVGLTLPILCKLSEYQGFKLYFYS